MARWPFAAALGAALFATLGLASARQPEIRISRTTTMAYLPPMVIEHEKLKRLPATWSELFFDEARALNGS
jgi:hypothetical protein